MQENPQRICMDMKLLDLALTEIIFNHVDKIRNHQKFKVEKLKCKMFVLSPKLKFHTLKGNLTSFWKRKFIFVEYFDNLNYNHASQPKGY